METTGDIHFDVDIVARDDRLTTDRADLDLHIDNTERLGADIDLNKTGVHGLVELPEARHETNGPCEENAQSVDCMLEQRRCPTNLG